MIPKEEGLCAVFCVPRIAVRRALADLEAEGLVQSSPAVSMRTRVM
ncbi:GntR family transcriptional regulator [Cupriavidus basilensis]|nr:GntR family transcriptional regulator [Cupriavidus basilensis]